MYGCKEMVYVCSALLYPSAAPIPYREEDAVSSDLGTIDACYSLAKAAGMQLASYYNNQYGTKYLTVVPCNFFGAHAIFTGEKAGVVPSLINRMHEAKKNGVPQVEIWGTGNACREFLNSKDVADACVYLIQQPMKYSLINIGRGEEYPIRDIAYIIKKVTGYEGELVFDPSKPEGRPHMQLDTTRLRDMGWSANMTMEESIRDAYDWYRSQHKEEVKKP